MRSLLPVQEHGRSPYVIGCGPYVIGRGLVVLASSLFTTNRIVNEDLIAFKHRLVHTISNYDKSIIDKIISSMYNQ